jgi:hypothetical protein
MRINPVAVVALSLLSAAASADPPTQLVGQVTDAKHVPVEGVTVRFGAQEAHTNAHGVYRLPLVGAGTYPMTFEYGVVKTARTVTIAEGQTEVADAALGLDLGEIIHVQPRTVTPVAPHQVGDPGMLPRYSDAAASSDTWARAWLLLDVSETGKVTRVKWLQHPGHDLDQIAVDTALATQFTPARDEHDMPKRSLLVHKVEWPSYWWLVAVNEGVTTHMPHAVGPYARQPEDGVPCAGSGPLHMGSVHPVYRDCSAAPDPQKFDSEPWIIAQK